MKCNKTAWQKDLEKPKNMVQKKCDVCGKPVYKNKLEDHEKCAHILEGWNNRWFI